MAKGDKKPVVMGEGIVNDLTTGGANAALSAEMGKVLANRTASDVGAAPAPTTIHKELTTNGWYKVGSLSIEKIVEAVYSNSCAATIYIGGQFANTSPTTAIVDIVCGYASPEMKIRACVANGQVVKLGLVVVEPWKFDIYAYYTGAANIVYLKAETNMGAFTSAELEASTLTDSDMTQIACFRSDQPGYEWDNPPMELGVEYRTTERYMGKPVYKQLINGGGLPAAGSVNIPIPSRGTIDYIISAKGSVTAQRVFPSSKVAGGMSIDLETHAGGVDVYTSHDWLGGAPFYLLVEYTLI